MARRATKQQITAADNRVRRAWRNLEKARIMIVRSESAIQQAVERNNIDRADKARDQLVRWQSALQTAEEDKSRAYANLERVRSMHLRNQQ